MKLFLRGNYTRVTKYKDSPIDEYKIIIESGNGEHTVIDFNESKLTKLRDQITEVLEN